MKAKHPGCELHHKLLWRELDLASIRDTQIRNPVRGSGSPRAAYVELLRVRLRVIDRVWERVPE